MIQMERGIYKGREALYCFITITWEFMLVQRKLLDKLASLQKWEVH